MNRRAFIQISSAAALPVMLGLFPEINPNSPYTVEVLSNRKFGHLLRNSAGKVVENWREVDFVIVGGGVAGVAAAYHLRKNNFLLLEADNRLGGSSASHYYKDVRFPLGAHYDLAYPDNYGTEVRAMLVELGIVKLSSDKSVYEFVEKNFVIPEHAQEQCFFEDGVKDDALSGLKELAAFYELIKGYYHKMPLPSRLIADQYFELNDITFENFLIYKGFSNDFVQRTSYHMRDDWGGDCKVVSALSGIHYYACRPYESEEIELFAPPQGNSYFVEKMVADVDKNRILLNSLVRNVELEAEGVKVEWVDSSGHVYGVKAKACIYAGQKHVLKYVFPQGFDLFKDVVYAPWAVVNLICSKNVVLEKWQNDIFSNSGAGMGFAYSGVYKDDHADHHVLSVYYCFRPEERNSLVKIESNPKTFVADTVSYVESWVGIELEKEVKHASIHLMGHAMPIPVPGYLKKNSNFAVGNVFFAGVDVGRLPLFYEAADTGIMAAQNALNAINFSISKNNC